MLMIEKFNINYVILFKICCIKCAKYIHENEKKLKSEILLLLGAINKLQKAKYCSPILLVHVYFSGKSKLDNLMQLCGFRSQNE